MKIGIVQIRGIIRTPQPIRDTLQFLNLGKPNHVAIVEDAPHIAGMLRKVEPFITWGPVDDKTVSALEKRGGKKSFALGPPKKGYGKKGIKMNFRLGGGYGDRKENINDLITRMI